MGEESQKSGKMCLQAWFVLQGPCCFGICSATVLGWTWLKMGGRKLEKLDFLSVLKATLGSGDMCLQAWFVLQGPAVLAFVVLLFWTRLG